MAYAVLILAYLLSVSLMGRILWNNRHDLMYTRCDVAVFSFLAIVPFFNMIITMVLNNCGYSLKLPRLRIWQMWLDFWNAPVEWK